MSSCAQTVGIYILWSPVVIHFFRQSQRTVLLITKNILTRQKIRVKAGPGSLIRFSVFDTKAGRTCLYFGHYLAKLFLGLTVNAAVNTLLSVNQLELML